MSVVAICMGFKRYHLKTHAFCKSEYTPIPQNLLKPMRIAAKDTPRHLTNHTKVLETHVYSSNYTQHIHAESEEESEEEPEQSPENFSFGAPATGNIFSRTRTASHRTYERIEIEINFPVTGGRINRTSSPLTSDIYIYI